MDRLQNISKTSTPVAPKVVGRSYKTPFQATTFQRGFKTDCQPKTRYNLSESTNNDRQYPSTNHRNQNVISRLQPHSAKKNKQTKTDHLITSRLGNIFASKTPKIVQPPLTTYKTPKIVNPPLPTYKTPKIINPPLPTYKTPKIVHPPLTTYKTPLINQDHKTLHDNIETKTNVLVPPTATKTLGSTSSTTTKREYNIYVNEKKYKVLRKLGAGGSAKVYEALDPKTLEAVAIKIIGLAKADERSRLSYFNELSILEKLKGNEHVVQMFDSEHKVDVNELIIVMEKGDRDLAQIIENHLKRRKNKYIDASFIRSHWRPMVEAVNEIHKLGIVHADLKPVNFIMTAHGIKLIDFGIAELVDPGSTSIIRDYQIGTINYMAPESLRNRALDASFISQNSDQCDDNLKRTVIKYNGKADIWSLGCILYNLVYGRPPFDKYKDFPSKMQAIIDPRYQIEFPQLSNHKVTECMKLCLRYDVKQRPTAEELLRQTFLTEDYVALL